MNAETADVSLSKAAAAIAEPARARMLCRLLDGHARTATELAVVADVTPSTASTHLSRLKEQRLLKVSAQGKHRYYSLENPRVASALEALMVVAGAPRTPFVPSTPHRLRAARTCYDHMAGSLAVALNDRFLDLAWLSPAARDDDAYDLSNSGTKALEAIGVDVEAARARRRRFAYACVDWSERRPHLGGALGAALLDAALRRRWVGQDDDSRALSVHPAGVQELSRRFGVRFPEKAGQRSEERR